MPYGPGTYGRKQGRPPKKEKKKKKKKKKTLNTRRVI